MVNWQVFYLLGFLFTTILAGCYFSIFWGVTVYRDVENPGKKLPNWGYIAFKKPYDKASHPFESPAFKFSVKNEVCQISYCTKNIHIYIHTYTHYICIYIILIPDSGALENGMVYGYMIDHKLGEGMDDGTTFIQKSIMGPSSVLRDRCGENSVRY